MKTQECPNCGHKWMPQKQPTYGRCQAICKHPQLKSYRCTFKAITLDLAKNCAGRITIKKKEMPAQNSKT